MNSTLSSRKATATDGVSEWCEAVAVGRIPSNLSHEKAAYNLFHMSQEQT